MMNSNTRPDELTTTRRVFRLLVLYRWLSLIPPLWALAAGGGEALPPALGALAAAVAANLLITLVPAQLNSALRRRPWLLASDLVFCGALAALTGGWSTPYYLYTLSPLLAGAFFFQLRGALMASAGMAGLFLAAGLVGGGAEAGWLRLVAQVVGIFLIAGAFGFATTLLAQLQSSHTNLDRMHRDLEVIHSLTLSLQSASDVVEVEERILTAVTDELGFPRAVVALVDQSEGVITSWLGRTRDGTILFAGGLPHPARIPLSPEGGAIAQCLLDGQARLAAGAVPSSNDRVDGALGDGPYHIFPMQLREHAVGVLLVGAAGDADPARLTSLRSIASQAAVAMGTTMLCIDRAQRLAVQDERIRIAREMHDTVSQSLFGLTYSLDACIKLLPADPETVKTELRSLVALAEGTRAEVRQSILDIWPSDLSSERFAQDLRRYAADACRGGSLEVGIDVRGDFSAVPARTKRSLYRIAQEALSNVVQHAGAHRAKVCVEIAGAQAMLAVRDDGCGFDPRAAQAREFNREHFGLRGIGERAVSLAGQSEVLSQPGAGTTVLVSLPVASL